MLVLGVDPGSVRTGWALLDGDRSRPRMIESGLISLPTRLSFPERLAELQSRFEELLRTWAPSVAGVEAPFHGVNARSALQLAHSRGVLLAALVRHQVAVEEYSPATVKKTITGNGRAEKEQVRSMIGSLLGVELGKISLDRSDALAVAYCHLVSAPMKAAVARACGPPENPRR